LTSREVPAQGPYRRLGLAHARYNGAQIARFPGFRQPRATASLSAAEGRAPARMLQPRVASREYRCFWRRRWEDCGMRGQEPPSSVRQAARAFHLSEEDLVALPGAAGQTWAAGPHVLRVRPPAALERELAACTAAGAVLPVPGVIDIVHLEAVSAVLVERLPGRAAGELDGVAPEEARRRGLACGHLHAALAEVMAPGVLPLAASLVAMASAHAAAEGNRLLHLDLHPFNVLVDEGGQVSGVIDWANAAAGHPDLDRARSAAILKLDPAAVALRADPAWAALAEGWEEAASLSGLPAGAMVWACRYMLADLSSRYDEDQLAGVHRALDELTRLC
jgi:aminoglycoside phosphotransferase (APT) family kinase protein